MGEPVEFDRSKLDALLDIIESPSRGRTQRLMEWIRTANNREPLKRALVQLRAQHEAAETDLATVPEVIRQLAYYAVGYNIGVTLTPDELEELRAFAIKYPRAAERDVRSAGRRPRRSTVL